MAAYVARRRVPGPNGQTHTLYADSLPELHMAVDGVLSKRRYRKSPPHIIPHYLLTKRQAVLCIRKNGALDGEDDEHNAELADCRHWWRRATAKRLMEKCE
jgi:hypothetical protein